MGREERRKGGWGTNREEKGVRRRWGRKGWEREGEKGGVRGGRGDQEKM